jgi:hypothetical protein
LQTGWKGLPGTNVTVTKKKKLFKTLTTDRWNGLGIIFDSLDNDNNHNNPFIMSMVNDGTLVYDHHQVSPS